MYEEEKVLCFGSLIKWMKCFISVLRCGRTEVKKMTNVAVRKDKRNVTATKDLPHSVTGTEKTPTWCKVILHRQIKVNYCQVKLYCQGKASCCQ